MTLTKYPFLEHSEQYRIVDQYLDGTYDPETECWHLVGHWGEECCWLDIKCSLQLACWSLDLNTTFIGGNTGKVNGPGGFWCSQWIQTFMNQFTIDDYWEMVEIVEGGGGGSCITCFGRFYLVPGLHPCTSSSWLLKAQKHPSTKMNQPPQPQPRNNGTSLPRTETLETLSQHKFPSLTRSCILSQWLETNIARLSKSIV